MKIYLWISYFTILFLIAGSLGYLIALCPCNTSMGSGMLYCLICYFLLAVSIVFHGHKIAQIEVAYSILLAAGSGSIGGLFAFAMSEIVLSRETMEMITPTYFMEWFVSCSAVGIFCAIGIYLVCWIKQKRLHASAE